MTIKMRVYLIELWTLEAGYKLLNVSKNMLPVQSVQVIMGALGESSVVCLTFQKQVSKSLFDLRHRWCPVLNSCLLLVRQTRYYRSRLCCYVC